MNQTFDDTVFTMTTKKKKEQAIEVTDFIPPPMNFLLPEYIKRKLQILSRLTIKLSKPSHLQRIAQSENFKKYNLTALAAKDEAVFQISCTSKLFDMVLFDAQSTPWLGRLVRKLYRLAVDQNMYFEVPYAPAIDQSDISRAIISAAHTFHAVGKSENIVVTSGAKNSYELRGPYDVIALGLILGLNEEQSKSAITHKCKNLLLRAEGRRFGRAVMTMKINDIELDSESEEESDSDNKPKVKRHCADPQTKPVTTNKDNKT